MGRRKQKIKRRIPAKWRKLVGTIENGNEVEVVEAAKELANLRIRRSVKPLVRLFQEGRTMHIRENACYALAWMRFSHLTPVFIGCLRDEKESERVRGQAAEALEILHGNNPRASTSRRYRAAENVLIKSLTDPSPTVRFWCCFALGGMGSKRAVEPLLRLKAFDKALCPGWWYLREEASDALDRIQRRDSPDRIPVHLRSKSRK